MRGKIPKTNKISIDNLAIDQWSMFNKSLITELTISGITINSDKRKIRLTFEVEKILSPREINFSRETLMHMTNNPDESHAEGVLRIDNFLSGYVNEKVWAIKATIKGKEGNPDTPVVIIYYENIDLAIYTVKEKEESFSKFFPEKFSEN